MFPVARVVAVSLITVAGLSGCGDDDGDGSGADAKVQIVATHSILADMASRVAGEDGRVVALVPAGGDAHTYEPRPSDARDIAEADVLIENGHGFEEFLGGIDDGFPGDGVRVVAADGITPIAGGDDHDDEQEDEEAHEDEDDAHDHAGGADPHIWQSLDNAQTMVANIRDGLIAADPDSADDYRVRADEYLAEIAALDDEVTDLIDAVPSERRVLVTNHDTFGYFARDHDVRVLGSVLSSLTTGSEPAAGEIAELVDELRHEGVPAIFPENVAQNDVLKQIAEEAGVAVGGELLTDALAPAGEPGDTYLGMFRYNAETIASALAPPG